MAIDGTNLVLEADGTFIDDNDSLQILSREIFILLQKNEIWCKEKDDVELSKNSLPSTITIASEENYSDMSQSSSTETITTANIPVNENFWKQYDIPWNKLPSDIKCEIDKGNSDKRIINECVRLIISEIRNIKRDTSQHTLKIMAHKMISAYPKIFEDVDDDGEVLGDGSHTIFSKLYERNNYLNKNAKRHSEDGTEKISKKRKSFEKAGCLLWQPKTIESDDIQNSDIESLNSLVFSGEIESTGLILLEKTYPNQRSFINTNPTISEVKSNWPILLQSQAIFWHYNKLMGHSINILEENLKLKAGRIIKFGQTKMFTKFRTKQNNSPGDDMYIEILKVVTTYFKEDFHILFCTLGKVMTSQLKLIKIRYYYVYFPGGP